MAEKLILVDLNLNGNKFKNVAVEVLAAAPASPVAGQFYVNSTDGKFYYYNGTKWVAGAEYSMTSMSEATGTFPIYNQTQDTLFKLNVLAPSGNLTMAEENGIITIGIDEANLSVSTAVSTAIVNAKNELKGNASTDTYESTTIEGAKKYADKKIADLDKADAAVTNEFVTEVSEADGIITVQRARPTAGNIQVTGITGVTGTDAQTVLESLKALLDAGGEAGVVTITEAAGTGDVLKTYTFAQGGTQIGVVSIPKDFLVKSGQVRTCTVADEPVEGYQVGDKYLDFVINVNSGTAVTDQHIYILVKDLVDIYTGGNGIDVNANNVISITIDQTSEGFLTVGANGLKLSGVNAAITAAIEALDSSVAVDTTGPAAPSTPAKGGVWALTGVTEADGLLTNKTQIAVDQYGSADKAESNAKSYADGLKQAIDAYEVNGVAISDNPVISAAVAQGKLQAQDSGCEVTTPVPGSIKAFYNGAEVAVAIAYNGTKATITWNGSLKLDIYYLATAVTVSCAAAE